jgi:hypothetical protein
MTGEDLFSEMRPRASPQFTKLVSKGLFGIATWDSAKKTAHVPLQMNVAGNGTIKGILNGHFGRYESVWLNYYPADTNLDGPQTVFAGIDESFHFNPDSEYETKPILNGAAWTGVLSSGVSGFTRGVLAVLLVGLARRCPKWVSSLSKSLSKNGPTEFLDSGVGAMPACVRQPVRYRIAICIALVGAAVILVALQN